MKFQTDMDYVRFYAKKLAEDNSLFAQQKMLIESQMLASRSLFKSRFGTGEAFKQSARRYLRAMGILKHRKS